MANPVSDDRSPTNRLNNETSPYLLQHAMNPVDWYPWGEEAIQRARDEDRPIFLSIGYSACHWCHVMEHESFENSEIAAVMNLRFVNIKVDREERPDIDQIYMSAVQLMTGRGGWPMSVFLTPELQPFYGGTYFPPGPRMGMPGFQDILVKVSEIWSERREELLDSAAKLTEAVANLAVPTWDESELNESLLQSAVRALIGASDRDEGGFGAAPKFPHAMDLRVLLRAWKRFGDDEVLGIVTLTLDKMAGGGIYDQLGGGFHRYSTDHRWLAPHFEKMLYDNALLASCYLEGYQATGHADYARVVRETLDYVLREMTQPAGGFYSTQDADSEGVEGKFFVWSASEILDLLGAEDAGVFNESYDVSPNGNWEGTNILNRPVPLEQVAARHGKTADELAEVLAGCRQTLFEARAKRIAPARDDKVLVSWNGLMIAALSQAGAVLNESRYLEAAVAAADFVLEQMTDESGRLLHSYQDGRARFNAYLDDYACFMDGLVELYQATFQPRFLDAALSLSDTMIQQFHGLGQGGFFYTSHDHEQLIARQKDAQDGATPSGNSMAATALLKLSRLCGRSDLEEIATRTLELFSGMITRHSMSAGQSLIALDFLLGPTREIVVVDGAEPDGGDALLQTLHESFLPSKVVARQGVSADGGPESAALVELLTGKQRTDGAATVYVCERGTCREPVVGVAEFRAILDQVR